MRRAEADLRPGRGAKADRGGKREERGRCRGKAAPQFFCMRAAGAPFCAKSPAGGRGKREDKTDREHISHVSRGAGNAWIACHPDRACAESPAKEKVITQGCA